MWKTIGFPSGLTKRSLPSSVFVSTAKSKTGGTPSPQARNSITFPGGLTSTRFRWKSTIWECRKIGFAWWRQKYLIHLVLDKALDSITEIRIDPEVLIQDSCVQGFAVPCEICNIIFVKEKLHKPNCVTFLTDLFTSNMDTFRTVPWAAIFLATLNKRNAGRHTARYM